MNMYHVPDHPVIKNMMLTGYPDGREPVEGPRCPVCGDETSIYSDYGDGYIVGHECRECAKESEQ